MRCYCFLLAFILSRGSRDNVHAYLRGYTKDTRHIAISTYVLLPSDMDRLIIIRGVDVGRFFPHVIIWRRKIIITLATLSSCKVPRSLGLHNIITTYYTNSRAVLFIVYRDDDDDDASGVILIAETKLSDDVGNYY